MSVTVCLADGETLVSDHILQSVLPHDDRTVGPVASVAPVIPEAVCFCFQAAFFIAEWLDKCIC